MTLTEFLKIYKADKTNIFGDFVYQKRNEYGYSVRKFARILGISPVYLSDIENGNRPISENMAKVFMLKLHITEDEREAFMDLVNASYKNWPDINDYLIKTPKAREFLRQANLCNLSDSNFKKLTTLILKAKESKQEDVSFIDEPGK